MLVSNSLFGHFFFSWENSLPPVLGGTILSLILFAAHNRISCLETGTVGLGCSVFSSSLNLTCVQCQTHSAYRALVHLIPSNTITRIVTYKTNLVTFTHLQKKKKKISKVEQFTTATVRHCLMPEVDLKCDTLCCFNGRYASNFSPYCKARVINLKHW